MGRFKPNRAGYAALMNSAQVQAVIEGKADAVKAAADSALSDGGYRYEGHEVKEIEGKCKELENSFFDLQMENLQLKKELEKYKNNG